MKRESSPIACSNLKKPARDITSATIIADKYWPNQQRSTVTVREVSFETEAWKELGRIRTEVFVGEQNVTLEGEFDGLDAESVHLCLEKNGEYIGTCRLRLKYPFVKLERVCIVKSMRGNGYAEFLCRNAGRIACQKWPECVLVAHAQCYSLGLYQKIGAMVVSSEFVEEDIHHQTVAFLFRHKFAVNEYSTPVNETGQGIDDPDTIETIKKILALITTCRIVAPLDIFSIIAPYTHEVGLWLQTFTEYMVIVCTLSHTEFIESHDRILGIEKKLIDMVKHKLYVGHYSDVQKHWRFFAYATYLLISVSHFPNYDGPDDFFNRQKALEHLDLALCYGEKRTDDIQFIIKRSYVLKETLPVIHLELPEKKHDSIPNPLPNSTRIEEIERISGEVFLDAYLFKRKPVLIKGGSQMKAVTTWTLPNLAKILSGRTFPVEQGSRYTDDDWTQGFMSAEEFFDALKNPEHAPVYLAQHRLLEQIPELLDGVEVPLYCKATGLDDKDVEINVWIGPAGTISPLHQDPKENIFCQLNGKKFFRLIDVAYSNHLYPVGGEMHCNTSQVDVENPDFNLFPNFAHVNCIDAVVEKGDLLYIPQGWFHYVKSLTPSSSLSFWFDPSEK